MAAIDIGEGTGDYGTSAGANYTQISLANSADGTGTLDVFKIWVNLNCSVCKMGTWYTAGANYTNRDYENIGSVTSGSEQTFTGKNCDVSTGDFLGCYTDNKVEVNTTGGGGRLSGSGDYFGITTSGFTTSATHKLAVYATGATGGGASIIPHILTRKPFRHMLIR